VHPDKPALIVTAPDEILTYQQLTERSSRLVTLFSSYGLQRGDHIAVYLENHARYLEIAWGALLSGLYLTPISTFVTLDEATYIVENSRSKVFISSQRGSNLAEALPEQVTGCEHWLMIDGVSAGFESYESALNSAAPASTTGDEPLGDYMFYSSGTTGRPKGILRPLTHRTARDGTLFDSFLSKVLTIGHDSVYLSPAPLYHSAPMASVVSVTSLGGTVVMMRKFDALESLEAIERYGVTHSQWVPTMFVRLLRLSEDERQRHDLSTHRVAVHSAAPCPRHVKEQMMAWWGPILHEYYNGTENAGATYVGPDDWLAHPGTVGRPLGFTLHVCDDEGNELGPGQDGRIYVERPAASFEYHGDPAKTRSSRHPRHDNWMTLDDVGYLDSDGYLYLTDRASFMIISGGVNVYPREVEDCILRHDAVADVAVIGLPDDDMGETVTALVELVEGIQDRDTIMSELQTLTYDHLAGPKRPRRFEFVEALPRMPNGKLAKGQLRRDYLSHENETRTTSPT
jgi:fatty-acyl-CoA synthase